MSYLVDSLNISDTGTMLSSYYLTSNPNQFSTSGNIQTSGSNIYNMIVGLSGKLNLTGSNLQSLITTINNETGLFYLSSNPSGYIINSGFSLSTTLATTGSNLYSIITGFSGQAIINYATISNLTSTGVTIENQITSLSGYSNNTFGTVTNLFNTGSNLQGQVNTLTTNLLSTGQTNYNLTIGLSGTLQTTGTNLNNLITTLTTNLASTGQQDWNTANNNAINISGNLQITGSNLNNLVAIKPQQYIQFSLGTMNWTAMPGATTFFNGSQGYITYADLTNYTGINLVINILSTGTNASGALFVGYNGNFNATASNYLPIDSSSQKTFINTTNTVITSGFKSLVAGAKSGVYLALIGSGGAALTPVFGNIGVIFK